MTSSWDFPRGPSGIRTLVDLDGPGALVGSGIDAATLEDPETVVTADQELAVVRNVVRATGGRPGVGADAGRRLTLGMLGIWGYAMLLAPTVGDAFALALRHGPGKLSWVFLRPRFVTGPAVAGLRYDDDEIPADVRAFLVERDLAATATVVPSIVGRDVRLTITTSLPADRRRALARAVPHAEVRAGDHHAVTFPRGDLDRPLPTTDPHALAAFERDCEELVQRRRARSGLAVRVRAAVLRGRPAGPTFAECAAEQHVDPRTLRRRLRAEGTTFRELRDEARATLAVELLRSGLSVQQVAHRVGYADAATFTRAYKRWTGDTPGATRRAAGRPAPAARAGAARSPVMPGPDRDRG